MLSNSELIIRLVVGLPMLTTDPHSLPSLALLAPPQPPSEAASPAAAVSACNTPLGHGRRLILVDNGVW